ncbi:MAG: hypothetical protein O7G88_10715 [bacterium]|nr:hypothetical protein [bacterium]
MDIASHLDEGRDNHLDTIPNQINQPTSRPTLRWVFQVLEGIERVRVRVEGKVEELITGLNEVKIKILRFFGERVCQNRHE